MTTQISKKRLSQCCDSLYFVSLQTYFARAAFTCSLGTISSSKM